MLMTLYEYLRKNLTRNDPHPAIDHALRAELHADGRISFYIHPENRDGVTPEYWISDTGIFEKRDPMPAKASFLSQPKEFRDSQLAAMAEKLMQTPVPGTAKYDDETELIQEASDAMRNLPLS
jgi:hypothetical protein